MSYNRPTYLQQTELHFQQKQTGGMNDEKWKCD